MLRGRISVLQHWQLVSSGWMVRGSLVMALIALHPPSSAGVVWGHLPLPVSDPCTARHWWAKDSLRWAWAVLQDSLLQPWGQLSPAAGPCSPLQGSKSSCKHLSDSWDLSENNAKKKVTKIRRQLPPHSRSVQHLEQHPSNPTPVWGPHLVKGC